MKRALFFLLATFSLAGCDSNDEASAAREQSSATDAMAMPSDTARPMGTPATPTDAASYVAKAGASDLFEIEISKTLLSKSNDPDMKSFAQMMVDDHGASTAKLKAAAQKAGVKVVPPVLDAEQKQMLDAIKSTDANAIDAIYLADQKNAHEAALALHKGYAAVGDTDALKQAASEIVPVIEKHRAALDKLNSST